MTIKKIPLSDTDKRLLKRAFKIRIIFGIIFLLPLLAGAGVIFYLSIYDLISSSYDVMTFFGIALILIVIFLVYKFVIPFYKKSFKNSCVKDKLIVTTRIIKVEERQTTKGPKYLVVTDYMTINSWSVSVLQPKLMYPDMYVNMMIEVHLLEGNRTDIICIGKVE